MSLTLVQGAYIVAGLMFILALAGLSKHETAVMGNRYGIMGMAIALVFTILAAVLGVSVADLPYVRVVADDGQFLTSSRLEAHRLAASWLPAIITMVSLGCCSWALTIQS